MYRAHDTKLKRDVALKILPDSFAADPDHLARFQREAQVLASLNHPNIAHIHGLEESNGIRALVMELVEGEDLAQRIARGAIPIDEALPIAKQIAEALEAAHEQGIIHRDLKPANIKVRPDGTVKVLDFGLAKALEPTAARSASVSMSPTITSPAMTQAGIILGTAAYMSPEQAKGRPAGKRSDVWAFGAVLFEMLTGKRAFDAEDVPETFVAVLRADVKWELLAGVPAHVSTAIRRCLQKDPKQRIGDVQDVRLALEGAFDTPVPETAPSRRGFAPRLLWLVAATGVVGALVGAVTVWFSRGAELAVADPPVYRSALLQAPGAFPATQGNPTQLSLSPNGKYLAYVMSDAGGQNRLWVRSLDGNDSRLVPGTERVQTVFWSPDSREMGFVSDGHVSRRDVAEGPISRVCDAASSGSGGAWAADGTILIGSLATVSFGLRGCSASGGGEPRPLTSVEGRETTHSYPFMLPDGRHFLYTAYLAGGAGATGIYATALGSNDRTLVLSGGSNSAYANGYLLFMRSDTLMAQPFDPATLKTSGSPRPLAAQVTTGGASGQTGAFSVSQTGVLAYSVGTLDTATQLQWFDRRGKRLGAVGEPANYRNPRLSPDETTIAVEMLGTGAPRNRDIWLLDVKRSIPSRFTTSAGIDASPLWLPDGHSIVYGTAGANTAILQQRLSASTPEPDTLLKLDFTGAPQSFAAREGALLFTKPTLSNIVAIYQLTLADGKIAPLLQGPSDIGHPALSPDGRSLAYVSRESGRPDVYLQDYPAATQKLRISGTGGGAQPVWKRDGKELYYLAPDGGVMAVEIGRDPRLIAGTTTRLFGVRVEGMAGSFTNIYHQFDVAGDGRFLVNAFTEDNQVTPFALVVNWPTLLKDKAQGPAEAGPHD